MTKKIGKSIEVGQFVTVQTSDFAAQYGVKKGAVLYVAGDGTIPVSEEDPYALRRILLCAKTDKMGNLLVSEGAITIDGLKLKAVTKPKQARLTALLEGAYGEESPNEGVAVESIN